jgi:hypothetical protein
MKSLLKLSAFALVATLVCSTSASAKDMSWSIYGGMSNPTGEGSPDGSFGVRANGFYMTTPVIGVGAEVGYHKFGTMEEDLGGGNTMSFSSNVWQFTPAVKAQGVTGTVRPYGIGGLGMYSMKGTLEMTGFPSESETSTDFGFNLGAGAEFGTGPTTFGVEARWHSIATEGESTDMISFMGGINFH